MKHWKRVCTNSNRVQHQTERAVLIKMPNNSEYKGFMFWHPLSLCKFNRGKLQIYFTCDFVFELNKYVGNTRKILRNISLDADELMEAFGFEIDAAYYDLSDLKDE